MAQYLRFLLVLIVGAIFNPHNLNTKASTLSHTRTKNSANPDETDWEYALGDINNEDCIKEKGATYCTEVKNYPDDIDKLLSARYQDFLTYFANENVQVNETQGTEERELSMCSSKLRLIYPQSATDQEFNWVTIINTKVHKQGVLIEECSNEGETCGEEGGVTVPHGYRVVCKQEYVYRALIGYKSKSITRAHFRFPSCCKCVLISGE